MTFPSATRTPAAPPNQGTSVPADNKSATTATKNTSRPSFLLRLFAIPMASTPRPPAIRTVRQAQPSPKPAPLSASPTSAPASGPAHAYQPRFSLLRLLSVISSRSAPAATSAAKTAKAANLEQRTWLGNYLQNSAVARREGLYRLTGGQERIKALVAGKPAQALGTLPDDQASAATAYKRLVKANPPLPIAKTDSLLKAVLPHFTSQSGINQRTQSQLTPSDALTSAIRQQMNGWTAAERANLIDVFKVVQAGINDGSQMTPPAMGTAMGHAVFDELDPAISSSMPAHVKGRVAPALFAHLLTDFMSPQSKLFAGEHQPAESKRNENPAHSSLSAQAGSQPASEAPWTNHSNSLSDARLETPTSSGTPSASLTIHGAPTLSSSSISMEEHLTTPASPALHESPEDLAAHEFQITEQPVDSRSNPLEMPSTAVKIHSPPSSGSGHAVPLSAVPMSAAPSSAPAVQSAASDSRPVTESGHSMVQSVISYGRAVKSTPPKYLFAVTLPKDAQSVEANKGISDAVRAYQNNPTWLGAQAVYALLRNHPNLDPAQLLRVQEAFDKHPKAPLTSAW